MVEDFACAEPGGEYVIDVAVPYAATGRVSPVRARVSAFAGPPVALDLLLAAGLRVATGSSDTLARGGEVRKGDVFVETSGRPVLTPERSQLGYYLELYPERPETAQVAARGRSPAGAGSGAR